jgi:hypothetical protein
MEYTEQMQIEDELYYLEGSYYNNQEIEVYQTVREYFIDEDTFNDYINSSDFKFNKIAKILNV